MIFSPSQQFNEQEIQLVKNLLEKFIGLDKKSCRNLAENNGFIFLDNWSQKMGFVKEEQDKYLILSLRFENNRCYFYQVIVKESEKKWADGKIIDYNNVRKLGIIDKQKNG